MCADNQFKENKTEAVVDEICRQAKIERIKVITKLYSIILADYYKTIKASSHM